MIRTAIVAVFLTLHTLIAAPPLMLHALLTGNPELLFRVGRAGAYFSARLVGLKIKVEGREKIPPGTCLFLANHTSFVDPVPIVWAIHRRIAILLKRSLLSIRSLDGLSASRNSFQWIAATPAPASPAHNSPPSA